MPGDKVDSTSYYSSTRFARAKKKTATICRLFWTCPICKASNTTTIDTDRQLKLYGTNMEAKCGKCHGQKVYLIDSQNRHILIDELLPHA